VQGIIKKKQCRTELLSSNVQQSKHLALIDVVHSSHFLDSIGLGYESFALKGVADLLCDVGAEQMH